MISISGIFSVTFSVVFAYVADITDEDDRSAAYGLVSLIFFFMTKHCLFLSGESRRVVTKGAIYFGRVIIE